MTTGTGWVVLKFGGTSVASPRALRRVAAVVARTRREARVAVVVSALAGVTSALEAAATAAARGQVVGAAVAGRLRRRHRVLLHRLAAPLAGETARELEPVLRELRERLDAITAAAPARPEAGEQASLLAIGERLAVNVVAAVLRTRGLAAQPVDARVLLVANGDALEADPDLAASAARTQAWLAGSPDIPVVTGFFATNAQDELVLLGRGGSDLSATLLAHALAATRVEIWTDTPGVLTADPRIEPQARVHRTLSPEQANRLARLGARVLHPRTLEPLRLRRIPLLVRDSFHPERAGTRVASDVRTPFATVVTGPLLVRVASDAGVGLPRAASPRPPPPTGPCARPRAAPHFVLPPPSARACPCSPPCARCGAAAMPWCHCAPPCRARSRSCSRPCTRARHCRARWPRRVRSATRNRTRPPICPVPTSRASW